MAKTSTIAPTCTAGGHDLYTCNLCNEAENRNIVSALGHLAPGGFPATCTTPGNTGSGTCTRPSCGEIVTGEIIPALGHSFTVFISTTSATCTTAGYDIYKCVRCIETEQQNPVSVLGHDHTGVWKLDNSDHWKVCLRCSLEVNKANHNFVSDVCTDCSASDVMSLINLTNTWSLSTNSNRKWILSNNTIRYERNEYSPIWFWQSTGGTWEAVTPTGPNSSDYPLGLKFVGGTITNNSQTWTEPVHFFFSLDMSIMVNGNGTNEIIPTAIYNRE